MMRVKFKSSYLWFFLAVATILIVVPACSSRPYSWHGTPYNPPQPAPDIRISNTTGPRFTLSEQRGMLTLLYFGYSYCPDVCPATVAIMSQVFESLRATPDEMQFVMISLDPERESPEAVEAYMRRFHPDFIGLWADRALLDEIEAAYGIVAIREPSDNPETYLITHTARVFLIDQQGNLRAHYAFGTPPADFIADLSYLKGE
ncbi:MAG: SCO family protein [Anaerolineales bacterium]|nr:MAG: SCO family protein [Anaerolineales bacterium]